MRNNVKILLAGLPVLAAMWVMPVRADVDMADGMVSDVVDEDITPDMDDVAAAAIANYDVNDTLFQQITDLEQQKVLMQLEKERAQLDLELDRLAAEKIKLHMEIDTLSGRAAQQQQEIETERARLEAEAASLAAQKEALERRAAEPVVAATPRAADAPAQIDDDPISDRYRLVNVIGAGTQLQATIEDLSNGQNKRVSVGKTIDGYTIQSISLDDGVAFVRDGVVQHLNIGGAN